MFSDLDSFFALFTMVQLNRGARERGEQESYFGLDDCDPDDLDLDDQDDDLI